MVSQRIEDAIQAAFIRWVRLNEKREPRLKVLFAVPNGSYRLKKTAALLKMQGLLPGIPDLVLPVPISPYCGLMIEFKRPKTITSKKGYVRRHQKELHIVLRQYGWRVDVCYTMQEAIDVVTEYLK